MKIKIFFSEVNRFFIWKRTRCYSRLYLSLPVWQYDVQQIAAHIICIVKILCALWKWNYTSGDSAYNTNFDQRQCYATRNLQILLFIIFNNRSFIMIMKRLITVLGLMLIVHVDLSTSSSRTEPTVSLFFVFISC